MKKVHLAFIFALLLTACHHGTNATGTPTKTIATIASLSDAKAFAIEILKADSPFYYTEPFRADSLIPLRWYHTDFDSDGRADLLFIFAYHEWHCKLCLIDSGNGHIARYSFWHREKQADTTDLAKAGGHDAVLYPRMKDQRIGNSKKWEPMLVHDTLIFKYGRFVEYNRAPEHHDIDRIEYRYYSRFYKMNFDITIRKKTMTITLDSFAYKDNGRAEKIILKSTPIDSPAYAHLTDVLNYADFAHWEYKELEMPHKYSHMTVYYDWGETKSLYDCDNLGGGFTLMYFNRLMIQLCKERNWNQYIDPDR